MLTNDQTHFLKQPPVHQRINLFKLTTKPAVASLSVSYPKQCESCQTYQIEPYHSQGDDNSTFYLNRNQGSQVFLDTWDESWSKVCSNFTLDSISQTTTEISYNLSSCSVINRESLSFQSYYLPVILMPLFVYALIFASFFVDKILPKPGQNREHEENRSSQRTSSNRSPQPRAQAQSESLPQTRPHSESNATSTSNTQPITCELIDEEPLIDSEISENSENSQNQNSEASESTRKRLKSLDTFRGFAILAMIFCNYGGGGYWWFRHSFWYGLTVADVIYPMFIFSLGTSITISRKRSFYEISMRSLKLISLGVFLSAKSSFIYLRLPGVLQRLGATYFITACIDHFLGKRTEPQNSLSNGLHVQINIFADFTGQKFKWITIGLIQTTWFLLTFIPKLENCPRGYIGPGGLSDHSKFYNCTAGISKWLDLTLFSENHVYPRNPVKHAYFEPEAKVFVDPEGFLGTLNCIVLAFLGGQVGKIFNNFYTPSGRIGRLLAWSFLTAGLGGIMVLVKIPVVKSLWTPSYNFLCCSISFLMIGKLYWVIDVSKGIVIRGKVFKMGFYPLQACGRNPILLYVGHELFRGRVPFVLGLDKASYVELFIENAFGTFLWMVIAVYLDRNKFYLKI